MLTTPWSKTSFLTVARMLATTSPAERPARTICDNREIAAFGGRQFH